ncbi:hypothetical protein NHL51_00145 [Leucobacter sp. gxy201]|uniref:hypothetical protein n=1 Tax=Leucobacter sp. gxy201 TaxID=2957200 RepID=UPI003DA09AD0
MARHLDPLPRTLGAAFTAAEARALGLGSRRLNAVDVVRLAPGYYARAPLPLWPGDAATGHPAERWRQYQRAVAKLIGPLLPGGVFFAGRTAAAIHRLPVPAPRALPQAGPAGREPAVVANLALALGGIDLGCHTRAKRLDSRGFAMQVVQAAHVTVVARGALRVTDPASTWAMLAPKLGRGDAVALGDAVIREARIPGTARLERPPHAEIAELERLAAMPRRPGGPALRQMLALLSPHSASPPESLIRLLLLDWGLPEPRLDYDVTSPSGRLLGASEFAYPEYRFAIEYEGDHHRVEARQWNRDIEKYHDYREHGWEVFRVTSELLYIRRAELRERLLSRFRSFGWSG